VLDYKKIEPSQVFLHLVNFLKDMLRLMTQELGLDDEKKVYLGLVIFKERLAMYMLGRTLETLRDILLLMPSKSESLKHYQVFFKEYIDKIVVERKFTARFVGNSGQQHLIFGVWFLVFSITSTFTTTEVRKSEDTQRVTALLNSMTAELQASRA